MKKGNIHGGKSLGHDKVCLGVHIAKEIHTKLLDIAGEMELTMSDIVRIALKEFIAKKTAG